MATSNTHIQQISNSNNEKLLKLVENRGLNDVRECLKSKCSLNYTDWAGHSALLLAAINADMEMSTLLLKHGANVNQQSKLNKTALHFAAQNGHLDLVKYLVACGSFLNALDVLKMTPLHWAIERGHIDVVRYLCSLKKVNLSQVDLFNRTSMDIALRNQNDTIIKLLEARLNSSDDQLYLNTEADQTEIELDRVERIFKTSSLQKQTSSSGVEPPKLDEIPGLKDFYKKKYFVKGASFTPSPILPIPSVSKTSGQFMSSNTAQSSHQFEVNQSKQNKNTAAYLLDDYSDDDIDEEKIDADEIDDILEDAKKKRLSMSPMNKVDDTLKWIKSQSSGPDFSKFEFSLSEAGKLTLDYLSRNDPIHEEKRLFLKLVKDLEDEEKMSNQEKMSISGDSRCQDSTADLEDLLFS